MSNMKIPKGLAALGAPAVSLALFIFFVQKMMPFVPDDAYISFRYAEHLAQGTGLIFNPGKAPVEAYSNFLWIVLCALVSRVGDLPDLAPKLGIGFGALSILTLWLILTRRPVTAWAMTLALILFALAGPFVLYAVSGLETPLFGFLLLVSILCLDIALGTARRAAWLALACAGILLALTRPEGLLTFPLLIVLVWSLHKLGVEPCMDARGIFWASVLFGGGVVLYQIWRVAYFGEILPTPFVSKGGGGNSLIYAWSVNTRYFFTRQTHYFAPLGYYYLTLALIAGGALVALRARKIIAPIETLAFLVALAYGFIYFNFVDWMPGMRYYAALVGLVLIPLSGLERAMATSTERAPTMAIFALSVALGLFGVFTIAQLKIDSKANEESTRASLVPLGQWLRVNAPRDALLAMSDVGATPYYARLATLDINPNALTDLHIARNGFTTDYFFERNPGIVVLVSFSLTRLETYSEYARLLKDARFANAYSLIGITRYDWYADRSYWVYARRDLALPSEQFSNFPKGIGSTND